MGLRICPGKWTLQTILDHARQSDFGIFVVAPDDKSVIRDKKQWTVRDNVLFEIGVFMGALGPERTFLLWPSDHSRRVRLPSDLNGITTVAYNRAKPRETSHLGRIRHLIETMGRALRSSYNEIAALSHLLDEREIVFRDGTSASFKKMIAPVAARRDKPWFPKTPVRLLLDGLSEVYADDVVDEVFWWLIVDGIVTFDNINIWNDGDGEFYWKDSLDYTLFTDRGVVLLNQFRAEKQSRRKKHT